MATAMTHMRCKFDELSDTVKKDVVERYRDINVEHEWYDCEVDYWKGELEEIGFMQPEIHFSGFYSQGDGACFTCKHIDFNKFVAAHRAKAIQIFFPNTKIARELGDYVSACIKSTDHHYSHKYTCEVQWDVTEDLTEVQEKAISEFMDFVDKKRMELCDEIYKTLEDEYDGLMSDEAVAETLRINDYMFNEDGEICPEARKVLKKAA